MALQSENRLDDTHWSLLRLLQENARLSLRQIGQVIGLTAPAVSERIHRLEAAGILQGYHADVALAPLGLEILAFVHLTCSSDNCSRFRAAVVDMPQVLECHTVTGYESYIVKVAVASVSELERLLSELKHYGDIRTSLVLSTQVKRRIIEQPTR